MCGSTSCTPSAALLCTCGYWSGLIFPLFLQKGALIHYDPGEHRVDPEVHIYTHIYFEEYWGNLYEFLFCFSSLFLFSTLNCCCAATTEHKFGYNGIYGGRSHQAKFEVAYKVTQQAIVKKDSGKVLFYGCRFFLLDCCLAGFGIWGHLNLCAGWQNQIDFCSNFFARIRWVSLTQYNWNLGALKILFIFAKIIQWIYSL